MLPRRARVVMADDSSLPVVQLRFGSLQRPLRFTISSLLTNVDLRAGGVRPKHEPLARGHLDLIRHVRSGSGVCPCLHPNGCRQSEQKPLLGRALRRFHWGTSNLAAHRILATTTAQIAQAAMRSSPAAVAAA